MSKKTIPTRSITNELEGASLFFQKPPLSSQKPAQTDEPQGTSYSNETPPETKPTPKATQKSAHVSEISRVKTSNIPREKPRNLPTRDEIQEFSFRLRDELKVKVQAEVPHQWQEELEEMARKLKVKKLELYRFILGEFLGKVQRKSSA